MLSLYTKFQVWAASDEGATAVEYGLMVALIAVVIITAVGLLGKNLATVFGQSADAIVKPAP